MDVADRQRSVGMRKEAFPQPAGGVGDTSSPSRGSGIFPELVIADDVLARFQASRRAVVVPDAMAEEYGWRAGDLVPIVGDIWPKSDGSWDWEFEIAGTYGLPPESGLQPWFLLRYDYFNESVADWAKNEVGWVVARLDERADPKAVDVVCRGVTAATFALRPEVRIVSGRTLVPGRNEIIVGASAARQYAGLDVGDSVQARTATLEVVGHFVAEGGAAESEIWMDRAISQSVFRRTSTVSVARVKLASDVDVQALNQRLAADPRLTSTLIPEQEFFAAQSASRAALIDAFAYLIAGIMALGSVFGALATMFTAVSRRSVEIATLRALGFQAVPVVVSVLVEATVLALAGGVLGAAVVYAILDGYTASTLNPAAGSQLAFAFRVTTESIWLGLGWAIAVGVIGGMAPAMRAARLPITTILRGV